MEEITKNELQEQEVQSQMVGYDPNTVYGFEESKAEDVIIPRIKVIQALSPERTDGIAVEGDILNSLTQEKVNGKRFIPVKQYYTNIRWNSDRNAELRMLCRSFDGKVGNDENGALVCAVCKKNQFDNSKQGKDAQPTCTAYLNFIGFFEGDAMPVVLSFAKTNYNEGKKLLSMAKSMRASSWNYAYALDSKKVSKDKNSWYIMVPRMDGQTSPEIRTLAYELYRAVENVTLKADYEDTEKYNEDVTDGGLADEI
jgi:hypothetical protein